MPAGVLRAGDRRRPGRFSSLLGIGGGTIAIMVMTLCGRTIHRAIATASGIGTLIAIPSTIGFAIIGLGQKGLPWGSLGYVNVPAALAVGCMSVLTAPLGVAAAHRLARGAAQEDFGAYLRVHLFADVQECAEDVKRRKIRRDECSHQTQGAIMTDARRSQRPATMTLTEETRDDLQHAAIRRRQLAGIAAVFGVGAAAASVGRPAWASGGVPDPAPDAKVRIGANECWTGPLAPGASRRRRDHRFQQPLFAA